MCICVCVEGGGGVQVSFFSPLASSALRTVVFHKEPALLSPHSGKQVAYSCVNSLHSVCAHDIIWRACDGVNLPGHFFFFQIDITSEAEEQ